MIKRVTIQFDVEITDELLAGGLLSDEDVIEQLKEAYNNFIRTEDCSDATIKIDTMKLDEIEAMPSENVASVVHAHWEWHYDIDQDRDFKEPFSSENKSRWICSHCKSQLEDLVGGKWDEIEESPDLEYCPHCGAKMDEKKEEK